MEDEEIDLETLCKQNRQKEKKNKRQELNSRYSRQNNRNHRRSSRSRSRSPNRNRKNRQQRPNWRHRNNNRGNSRSESPWRRNDEYNHRNQYKNNKQQSRKQQQEYMVDEIQDDAETIEILKKMEQDVNIYMDLNEEANDKFPRKKYRQREDKEKKLVRHYGQRKLFMSELNFLTRFGDLSKQVIYAGSAPGNHIPYLVDLFPEHKFILVDPNPFSIEETDRIKIVNGYFTDEMCQKYQKEFQDQGGVLFISDIRTADSKIMSGEEHEDHIVKDNDLQRNWVEMLKPLKAMLKFRCPYATYEKSSFAEMLDGEIYIQPWAPQSSTECRLLTNADEYLKKFDNLSYEEKFFHHNDEVRKRPFENPIKGEGLLEDYDSCADILHIWNYLQKYDHKYKDKEYSLYKKICKFSHELTQAIGTRKYLGYFNPPKDQRFKFNTVDHRVFYKEINKAEREQQQKQQQEKQDQEEEQEEQEVEEEEIVSDMI